MGVIDKFNIQNHMKKILISLFLAFACVAVVAQTSPTIRVAGLADMAALTIPTSSGSFSCIVGGTSTAGDGPFGGMFVYVSGSSAATNANHVIAPASGVGRWIRVGSAYWNQFSAVTVADSSTYPLQILRNLSTNTFGIGTDNNNAYLQSFASYALHLNNTGNNVVLNGTGLGAAIIGNTLTVTNATTLASTVSVGGGTAIKAIYSAAAQLDFPAIPATAVTNLTITVAGAGTNSTVIISGASGQTIHAAGTNIVFSAFVGDTNTVHITAANATTASIDPPTASYRVTVFQY